MRVNSWSSVRESVIMDGAEVGRNTVVNRAILDKYVKVEEGAMVGIDPEHDRERGFTVTESGITVVAKGRSSPADRRPTAFAVRAVARASGRRRAVFACRLAH